MNFQLLEKTVAVFWDEPANFNSSSTVQKVGGELFLEVVSVHSLEEFRAVLARYSDYNQKFVFFVHLFHNEESKGFYSFRNSKIQREYTDLVVHYISSAPKGQVWIDNKNISVHSYDNYHGLVGSVFMPQTKGAILGKNFDLKDSADNLVSNEDVAGFEKIKYAIITAMYKDEFEELDAIFKWDNSIQTDTKRFRIGHLKDRPDIKIVAAIPDATGMVDAAITATLLMQYFRPDFLFMAGVCGGKEGIELGDIVVAKKIFTFQKGKVSDLRDKAGNHVELFDESGNPVNPSTLYDSSGDQIELNVEKFEIEHDSMINLNPLVQDYLEPHLESIKQKINNEIRASGRSINVHFDSMACSTMVVDKADFFEKYIKKVDRKTIAVEMESYGVARAVKFANNGRTKCIIAKSVMDNTMQKTDHSKRLAAKTSALFFKYLLEEEVLKSIK